MSTGNIVRDSALGLVPETLENYIGFTREVWEAGHLRPSEIEVARLRNASRVNCVYCKSVRYDIAKLDGLNEERVAKIDDGYLKSDLTDREKLIIAFTDQFLNDPRAFSAALKETLAQHFSALEMAQLAMAVAYFNGFSRCAVSLGGMPESLPVTDVSVPD